VLADTLFSLLECKPLRQSLRRASSFTACHPLVKVISAQPARIEHSVHSGILTPCILLITCSLPATARIANLLMSRCTVCIAIITQVRLAALKRCSLLSWNWSAFMLHVQVSLFSIAATLLGTSHCGLANKKPFPLVMGLATTGCVT